MYALSLKPAVTIIFIIILKIVEDPEELLIIMNTYNRKDKSIIFAYLLITLIPRHRRANRFLLS